MRQPKDQASQGKPGEEKRGRGRPRLPDALTAAQRAKRYRDNKRNQPPRLPLIDPILDVPTVAAVKSENERLASELSAARARIADLTGALTVVTDSITNGKRISADVKKGLYRLLVTS